MNQQAEGRTEQGILQQLHQPRHFADPYRSSVSTPRPILLSIMSSLTSDSTYSSSSPPPPSSAHVVCRFLLRCSAAIVVLGGAIGNDIPAGVSPHHTTRGLAHNVIEPRLLSEPPPRSYRKSRRSCIHSIAAHRPFAVPVVFATLDSYSAGGGLNIDCGGHAAAIHTARPGVAGGDLGEL